MRYTLCVSWSKHHVVRYPLSVGVVQTNRCRLHRTTCRCAWKRRTCKLIIFSLDQLSVLSQITRNIICVFVRGHGLYAQLWWYRDRECFWHRPLWTSDLLHIVEHCLSRGLFPFYVEEESVVTEKWNKRWVLVAEMAGQENSTAGLHAVHITAQPLYFYALFTKEQYKVESMYSTSHVRSPLNFTTTTQFSTNIVWASLRAAVTVRATKKRLAYRTGISASMLERNRNKCCSLTVDSKCSLRTEM